MQYLVPNLQLRTFSFCCFQLYSLLSFVEPDIFEDDLSEDFVEAYTNVSVTSGNNHSVIDTSIELLVLLLSRFENLRLN